MLKFMFTERFSSKLNTLGDGYHKVEFMFLTLTSSGLKP